MLILKVPGINGNGKTNGCEKAGNAVLDSMKEITSNEEGKTIDVSLLDLEEIHLDNKNLELTNNLIYENAMETFETKPKAIFIGGDHSISCSLAIAFLEYCKISGREPCLIIFDSHPNCFKAQNSKIPTNKEWLRALVDLGFPAENILLVGTRNSDQKEMEFISKNRIRVIGINQLLSNLEDMCDTIMEFSNGKELYLSLDISVVDPAFAPATENNEPGGLTSRQFIYLLQRINRIKNLRAVDLVEVNPEKPGKDMTVKLGAKIVSELV